MQVAMQIANATKVLLCRLAFFEWDGLHKPALFIGPVLWHHRRRSAGCNGHGGPNLPGSPLSMPSFVMLRCAP